jgi:hypothetical protein
MQCFYHVAYNPVGVELLGRLIPHTVATHSLRLHNGLREAGQSTLVFGRSHALLSRWQPIHDDARFACPCE